jgi:ACR3 family arsenite efflux pump ArsB
MENQSNKNSKFTKRAASLLFVGCMFIGMALGYYFENIKIGLFAGMGVGFVMMSVTILSTSKKD